MLLAQSSGRYSLAAVLLLAPLSTALGHHRQAIAAGFRQVFFFENFGQTGLSGSFIMHGGQQPSHIWIQATGGIVSSATANAKKQPKEREDHV